MKRGLQTNLGAITAANSSSGMAAQRLQALSALLPNISANASETVAQVNLAAYGFKFNLPPGLNFSIPSVVGPFSYSQAQGAVRQQVYDPVSRRNYQATREIGARCRTLFQRRARTGGAGRSRQLPAGHRHRRAH